MGRKVIRLTKEYKMIFLKIYTKNQKEESKKLKGKSLSPQLENYDPES